MTTRTLFSGHIIGMPTARKSPPQLKLKPRLPKLENATLLLALTGWMDGGDVSTGSVRAIMGRREVRQVARIEPDDFYIYNLPGSMEVAAVFRPHVKYDEGVVTEFVWVNPHCQIYLDVKDKNGNVVHWAVETNSPAILTRAGWTRRSFKAGDEVSIILCPAKNGAPVAYIGTGDPGTKVIFADGRELDFAEKTAK